MQLVEDFRIAIFGLLSNKLRSGLTILGVVIGVAAVIGLISVGQSAGNQVTAQVESLGSNLLIISPNRRVQFDMQDVEAVRERIPGLVAVTPIMAGNVTTAWGGQTHDTSLRGVGLEYLAIQNREVGLGRFFTQEEYDSRERVAVLGSAVVEALFGSQLPIQSSVMIDGQSYRVIGVLASEGASMGQDQDDLVLIPATSAQRVLGTGSVQQIYVQAAEGQSADLLVEHITAVMDLRFDREDSVNVFSQDQVLEVMDTMSSTLTLMLGAIAGISLLVGGIGVMNIMLVSVTERTREIGVRKALGASYRDIRNQFLVEAVLLSITGGIIGVMLGGAGSVMISRYAGWPPTVSMEAVLLAFGFSAAVGILFGLWPALSAASMDPVEALRYE